MVSEDTSTLDIVVLIVFVQAMNAFWSADSPYNGALSMTPDNLRRFEKGAAIQTVLVGLAASFLSKKALPAIISVLIALGFVWLYEYEYRRAYAGTTADAPEAIASEDPTEYAT